MKALMFTLSASLIAAPILAEEVRQLDAHEHGVGQLNIVFDAKQVAMELHVPGADIVGFEYVAESADDRAAVDAAVAKLAAPATLFGFPDSAKCTVVQASAGLEGDEEHEDEEHDEHDEHAEHEDDEHEEHAHEDNAHEEETHAEFHAEYLLNCANPDALTTMNFDYFDAFPNAQELEVQIISDTGATAFEVKRNAPILDLSKLF